MLGFAPRFLTAVHQDAVVGKVYDEVLPPFEFGRVQTQMARQVVTGKVREAERERQMSARAAERKGLVGSGDRSERIRTYNFPQGRMSDHRINLTLYKLERILSGDDLGEVIDALITEDQASRLAAEESDAA